jgi:hypothetical protein
MFEDARRKVLMGLCEGNRLTGSYPDGVKVQVKRDGARDFINADEVIEEYLCGYVDSSTGLVEWSQQSILHGIQAVYQRANHRWHILVVIDNSRVIHAVLLGIQ